MDTTHTPRLELHCIDCNTTFEDIESALLLCPHFSGYEDLSPEIPDAKGETIDLEYTPNHDFGIPF